MSEIEIPTELVEKLEQHSTRYDIPLDELKGELLSYLPSVKEQYPRYSIGKQMWLAYRPLLNRLSKDEGNTRSKAIPHTAFFIGQTGTKDESKKKIGKINRMIEKDPGEWSKYHPSEDEWLDYKEGKTYMKPIKPMWHNTLYAIGSSGKDIEESRVKFLKLEIWKEAVNGVTIDKLHRTYTFRANPKETDRQLPYSQLNASVATRLRPIAVDLSDEDKYNLLLNSGKDIFNLGEVQSLYETRFKYDPLNPRKNTPEPVFIEAMVSNIVVREEKQNIVNLTDDTDDGLKTLTAYMLHSLPIKFQENDRVVFLGVLRTVTFKDNTQAVVLYINGYIQVPLDVTLMDFV
jgi:hypothetical protein